MTTAVSLSANPILQFFNNQGQPNSGGYVLTQVGGVNYATYQDSAGTIPLPNPVPLNNRGEVSNAAGVSCQLFLVVGVTYTFTQYDQNGNQINQATFVSAPGGIANLLYASSGASLVGFIQAGTGAILHTVQDKLREAVSVADFGAVGDNVADDTAALTAALTATPNYGLLNLVEGKTYRTTAPITISPTAIGVVIKGNGAQINAAHTGNALVLVSTNENYSAHSVYDLNIYGPNVSYPANAGEVAGTSLGAGISLGRNSTSTATAAYNCHFYNVNIRNFKYGYYLQNCLLGKWYGGNIIFNQYGMYFDSGMSNANDFFGVSIHENRLFGLYSATQIVGMATPTQNRFFGGIFESNVPYNLATGGYPTAFDPSGNSGVAIKLIGGDNYWTFNDVYFEAHFYSVWLYGALSNKFNMCRFADGTHLPGGLYLDASNYNNTFDTCSYPGASATQNVTFNNQANQYYNWFKDCIGLVFNTAQLALLTRINNQRRNESLIGTQYESGLVFYPAGGSGVVTNNSFSMYEEGTWTPVVRDSSAVTQAASTATGRYRRVGSKVTVWWTFASSVNLAETNYYDITGIPFSPQDEPMAGFASSATNAGNSNQRSMFAVEAINTGARLRIRVSPAADFQNSDAFSGSATYMV